MSKPVMIRVGMKGDDFVLMLAGPRWGKLAIPMSQDQAADLHVQIRELLPTELLNVEPYSADRLINAPPTDAA